MVVVVYSVIKIYSFRLSLAVIPSNLWASDGHDNGIRWIEKKRKLETET